MEYAERRAGQPQRLCRAAFFWLVLAGCALVGTAQAQYGYGGLGQELASGGGLHEQEARFLPGIYYFDKGCEYARRGDIPAAVGAWLISAGWAMKPAQYNLGIVYFGGLGVPADRPRGLAWLALAAEREDSAFAEALAEAWDSATSAEHDEANKLWRALRERYADAVALPRAQKRYHDEASHITGSRVGMPGNVKVSAPGGLVDGASYLRRMSRRAELNFGRLPAGHVDVGPIESLDIPLPGPDD